MADALRTLLAQFTVSVDPEGNLKKGEAAVEGLKSEFKGLEGAAKAAGQAVQNATRPVRDSRGRFLPRGSAPAFSMPPGLSGWAGRSDDNPFADLARMRGKLPPLPAAAPIAPVGIGDRLRGVGSSLRSSFGGALSAVTSLRAGIAGLVGGVIINQVRNLVDEIGGIGEEAARLGVSSGEFQRLKVLAAQNATSVQALGTAFRTVGKAAVDGTDETKKAFASLGVELKNSDGSFRSRNDLFFDSALALADIDDETKRATVAQQLFGRSAIELLPLLASGREGIRAQRAEIEKLPLASESAIAAADRLSDRWATFGQVITGKAAPIIEQMIPLLEDITTGILSAVNAVADFTKESQFFPLLAATLKTVATPLRIMFWGFSKLFKLFGGDGTSTIAKLVNVIGRLGVAFQTIVAFPMLLIDDFQGFLDGKDSVIGRIISALPAMFEAIGGPIKAAFSAVFDWLVSEGAAVPGRIAAALSGGAPAGGLGALQFGGMQGMGIPLPPGANGAPPTAAAPSTVVQANGDRIVQVTMGAGASAADVARSVGSALERDRNADLAAVQ